MTTPHHWDAPAAGYELLAAVADGDEGRAAALLAKLDAPGLADLVTAMGAQARHAVRTWARPSGGAPALLAADVWELAGRTCARAAVFAVTAAACAPVPAPPGCPDAACLRAAALALAEAQLRAADAAGHPRSYLAAGCRRATSGGRP